MNEINEFKDFLLFEVQKAFYDERGKGARYRLTLAGVSFLKDKLKDKADNPDEIKKWLVDNGYAKNIEISEDQISFNIQVTDCCLKNIRQYFVNEEMQPLGCPIANMFMYALEKRNGLSPELLPIKLEDKYCGLTLAKMATSDVVEGI